MPDITWKPHPRQAEFLRVPDSVFEAMYGGAAGGGKSEALLNLPITRRWYENPRFKALILRRTFPELESELIVRSESQGIYEAVGGTYNREKKRWVFKPNGHAGGIIQFGHLEYDSDVRKYDSAEYNYIAFDELTSFTEYQYLYLFSRARSSSPSLPAIIRSGTNPGGIGHGWVRARFVEPAPYGTLITDKNSGLKRIFIQSKAQDNPYLMENDPQYINRLQGMAEKDRRAKLDGDWYTFSGQVFDDYREERFVSASGEFIEPDNAIHICDPFPIPNWWPRVLSVDWGYDAWTYVLWSAISPQGRVYCYREYAIRQAKISQWATEVGRLSNGEKFADIVMCQSAWQNRGDDLDIASQFEKYSGMQPRLADNRRVAGKLLLQEYFRWRSKPQLKVPEEGYNNDTANRILRTRGMEAYKEYVSSFEPEEPENNLPKLQIFKDLVVLRKTIPLCVYDDNKKEDVAEFKGDDPYDSFRYNIMAVDQLIQQDLNPQAEHYLRVDQAVKGLANNGDQTSYYRRMEKLEREEAYSVRPISRRRRTA